MSLIANINRELFHRTGMKVNFTPYHSEENPGLRANWTKAICAIVLVTLHSIHMSFHGGLTFGNVGFVLYIAFVVMLAFILCKLQKRPHRVLNSFIVIGIIIAIFSCGLLFSILDIASPWSVLGTLIVDMTMLGCLLGITFTRWVPLYCGYEDRAVRKARHAAEG